MSLKGHYGMCGPGDPLLGRHPVWGPLTGGPECCMSILRNDNVVCLVAHFPQCHMSNLRKGVVTCHYNL